MSLQQIIDRRLSGKNKSIGNRERFLRRHKDQIREAVKRAVDGRGIRDMERGEEVRIPKKDLSEPVFGHGDGGVREVVRPGNHRVREGRPRCQAQGRAGRWRGWRRGQRLRRGRRRLRLPPQQGRVHAGLLRRPGPAQPGPHLAGRHARVAQPARRLCRPTARPPTCTSCARCAAPWAGASPWAWTSAASCTSSKPANRSC